MIPMQNKTSNDAEVLKLEADFNNQIANLATADVKENNLLPENINSLQVEVRDNIQVDVSELSQISTNLIQNNDQISDEIIALELLKNIAKNNKSKFMRKLASKMIKEKWWEK